MGISPERRDEMSSPDRHAVTGAYGYSGRHIASMLLHDGRDVITITGHPERDDPFGGKVSAIPFDFDNPERLAENLEGTSVVYNTYWVRFDHGRTTHSGAVENTRTLIRAARKAGVQRFVHVSITNPVLDSHLPYFAGKAALEETLKESGMSYAILRPAVLFGGRDVLINNIAWILRRFPLFGLAGDGRYGIQPIHVEDQARLAVELGKSRDDVTVDAVGPECFEFEQLVRIVAEAIGEKARIVHMPRWMLSMAATMLRPIVRDVVLTRDEIDGLMDNLLVSKDEPTGATVFTDWLSQNADHLGVNYANELKRHFR